MPREKRRILELQKQAGRIRIKCLEAIYQAGSGHPGGSFSAAEIMTALYFEKMRLRPEEPNWPDRDRFILSKGHVAPVLYTTLAYRGFFPLEELGTLRRLGSRLIGHPAYMRPPGVDMVSGSLGQGLSIGLGMRMAAEHQGRSYRVYVLLGDGEIQEGQVWEAAMAAAHFKTRKLIAIVDYNRVQLDGTVGEIMEVEPLADKWRAFGWDALETDGHDVGKLLEDLDEAVHKSENGPVVVIARTVKGKGVSYMENKASWHGQAPNEIEYAQAIKELEEKYGGEKG